jgi:hypothetical protein
MILLALAACGGPDPADGDANVEVWSADVALSADHTVPAGTTLVVDPGVTVTFGEGVALIVEGELLARGEPDAPITFTGDVAARWAGIRFADPSVDATFTGVDVYEAGSVVENAVVEHATRGMVLESASPYLRAVTFRANEIPGGVDTVGGAGLLVKDGATPRIRECRFEGNSAKLFGFGGGLYVHHADPIVQDCDFVGNDSTYGGGLSTDWMASPIVGSRFEGNDSYSEGGGMSLVSTVSAVLANTVTGNLCDTDGAGIHVCVTCDPHAAPYLLDNVVTGNENDGETGDEGAAGVGAAYLGAMVRNDVHGNFRRGEPSDFAWFHPVEDGWPGWVADPVLSDMYWGTTDAEAIAATVWDGADKPAYGVVSVEDVRAEPLDGALPRAVISTRRQHYIDAGDEIPVFLTLYNPGPARSLTLRITVDGADWTGDLGYPGAAATAGGWTLDMPENSVWFGKIDSSTYDGSAGADVTWTATLSDGDTLVGVPLSARYVTGP